MSYHAHITDATQIFSDAEIIDLMPKSYKFIAETIGVEAALHLIETYGGTVIFVPSKHALTINHDIARVIGLNKLHILAAQFGNTTLEIPKGNPILLAVRNYQIRELAKKETKPKLARKFNLTLRTIRSIVNKPAGQTSVSTR